MGSVDKKLLNERLRKHGLFKEYVGWRTRRGAELMAGGVAEADAKKQASKEALREWLGRLAMIEGGVEPGEGMSEAAVARMLELEVKCAEPRKRAAAKKSGGGTPKRKPTVIAGGTAGGSLGGGGGKVASGTKMPDEFPGKWDPSRRLNVSADVKWIYTNMFVEEPDVESCPGPGAWGYLQMCRKDTAVRAQFYTSVFTKMQATSGALQEGDRRSDDGEPLRLLGALKKAQERGGVRDAGEEGGESDAAEESA